MKQFKPILNFKDVNIINSYRYAKALDPNQLIYYPANATTNDLTDVDITMTVINDSIDFMEWQYNRPASADNIESAIKPLEYQGETFPIGSTFRIVCEVQHTTPYLSNRFFKLRSSRSGTSYTADFGIWPNTPNVWHSIDETFQNTVQFTAFVLGYRITDLGDPTPTTESLQIRNLRLYKVP